MEQGQGEFILRTEVGQGVMETAQFGDHYLTYVRLSDNGRVASLDRYEDERAARAGHHRWVKKDWQRKSLSELIRQDG